MTHNPLKQLTRALARFSRADAALTELDGKVHQRVNRAVESASPQFAKLSHERAQAESEITQLAEANPGWFTEESKTIKLPVGSLAARDGITLALNEETTLPRLNQVVAFFDAYVEAPDAAAGSTVLDLARRHGMDLSLFDGVAPRTLRRERQEVNREALENLSDEALAVLDVKRTKRRTFTIKAAKVDMGKVANGKQIQQKVTEETKDL